MIIYTGGMSADSTCASTCYRLSKTSTKSKSPNVNYLITNIDARSDGAALAVGRFWYTVGFGSIAIITVNSDNKGKWKLTKTHIIREMTEPKSLLWRPDNKYLLSCCEGGDLILYSVSTPTSYPKLFSFEIAERLMFENFLIKAAWCPRQKYLLLMRMTLTDFVIEVRKADSLSTIVSQYILGQIPTRELVMPYGVNVSPKGDVLAFENKGRLGIMAYPELRVVAESDDGKYSYITFVLWFPCGTKLITFGSISGPYTFPFDCGVVVWEFQGGSLRAITKKLFKDKRTETGTLSSVAMHPDASTVAVGYNLGMIEIWNSDFTEMVQEYQAADCDITALTWSPLGDRLLVGTHDGSLDFRCVVPKIAKSYQACLLDKATQNTLPEDLLGLVMTLL